MNEVIRKIEVRPESLEDMCVWRFMYESGTSSTFADVHETHDLYACTKCNGAKEIYCANYTSRNKLRNKHRL